MNLENNTENIFNLEKRISSLLAEQGGSLNGGVLIRRYNLLNRLAKKIAAEEITRYIKHFDKMETKIDPAGINEIMTDAIAGRRVREDKTVFEKNPHLLTQSEIKEQEKSED